MGLLSGAIPPITIEVLLLLPLGTLDCVASLAALVVAAVLPHAVASTVTAAAVIHSRDVRLVFTGFDTPFIDSIDGGIMRQNVCRVKC
jgi:hypothetical protein